MGPHPHMGTHGHINTFKSKSYISIYAPMHVEARTRKTKPTAAASMIFKGIFQNMDQELISTI